ncbi:MAG TPA: PLP-dependent aspartate aminotransferase family protein [Pyrinomonadaceae bacterium]|nr:PLP-dependent aspartate aminotransferase family protein [Pyrinomonadaceae bacterium]
MSDFSMETKLVHAGERREPPIGQPVATPLYATATYTYDSMAQMNQVFSGEGGDYVYSRYGNPTVGALEEALATIEAGKVSIAYGSGMAAIHAALFACELAPNSTVLASQDLYGTSFDLLNKIFGSYGVKTKTADFNNLEALKTTVEETKPRALLAETISNPLLKVCDIEKVAEIAHATGARLIVDNTFASPYLCQPLNLGADFSVHSATKYLSGHADAMGGIVISNEEFDRAALVGVLKLVGGVLSVWEAHQILRGVKTLALRMEKQCSNTQILAETLSKNGHVEKVYYPNSAEDKRLTGKVLRGDFGGALVSIQLKDDTRDAAWRFMDNLKLCVRATSLGDVYTLVSHSASSSHRELSPKKRADLGIAESLVRISVGIEDVNDIIADVEQALEK